jgi:phytoene dehydrogenase-like protein/NAD-dependent dihydropyrimidine dehydrogenase PreA subunit
MKLIQERCTGCAYCVLVCPYDAITSDGWAEVLTDRCTDCNLCYYACPSDCFVPDAPLKPYRARVRERYNVAVIGAGIGGLMAAAALAREGHSVAVFEKLSFPGGRYTEIDYHGAAVTTGAWTSLGPKSHIGRFLADLDIELDYVSLGDAGLSEQYSMRFPDGRHYPSLLDLLEPDTRRAWMRAIAAGRRKAPDDVSAHDYMAGYSQDADLLDAVDAIAATASGLSSRDLPASEYVQITLDAHQAGADFAMPRGGVRSIVKGLTHALRAAGGDLFLRTPVARILTAEGRVAGIELEDGRQVPAGVVLHNGGPGRLVQLAGPQNLPHTYLERLRGLQGVDCAAVFCATRQPLFDDAPILMTPGCRRVVGIFAPTRLDPSLSRDGLYLYDAFFPVYDEDRSAELALALADMRALFPAFDEALAWYVPMFFTGAWPGTESGQTFGQTGENRLEPATPIEGLYLVGMDVKGSGVAGDLIPIGVRRLLDALDCSLGQ